MQTARASFLLWFELLAVAYFGASSVLAATNYSIVPLGLLEAEHTHSDGTKSSVAYELNEAGEVSGFSRRYQGGSASLGQSAWLYDGVTTINIGLTGTEHTRDNGYRASFVDQLNEAGQVSGSSSRYSGVNYRGRSVWIYDGETTIDIGFTGTEHTRDDGYKESSKYQLNEAGQVSGSSDRYQGGSAYLGQSAWLYDGITTIDIGLTGPEHTRNDGYEYSVAEQLTETGHVRGYSDRYQGGTASLGRSAWLYDGVTTIDIGLTDTEHTREDGYKQSVAIDLNEAGRVGGSSYRYHGGSADLGRSAWLYDGVTTFDIGLTGAEHTRNDGTKNSDVLGLNEASQVRGFSQRYQGGNSSMGYSAWLFDGVTTIEIGLTGAAHTREDGYQESFADQLNEAGQVSGYSRRYHGGEFSLGQNAWLYDGAATIEMGLTGTEHTASSGYNYSAALELNEAGQVRGSSERFNGGSDFLGESAWLFDGETTIEIGLTGSEHTRDDGYKLIYADQLNELGQVTGSSSRYNGGQASLGRDAWFYDSTLDQTFSLKLSQRSDGYAWSELSYLGEDGLALGSFELFDALDNSLGSRAFYFTISGGLHDLGALVDGSLSASGWDYLAGAVRANSLGQILGHGKLTAELGGQMAYLLTPFNAQPGDFDFDGDVDGRDFLIWQRGGSPSPLSGSDLADWQGSYGVGPLTAASVTVPEPGSLFLVCAVIVLLPARLRCASPRG